MLGIIKITLPLVHNVGDGDNGTNFIGVFVMSLLEEKSNMSLCCYRFGVLYLRDEVLSIIDHSNSLL